MKKISAYFLGLFGVLSVVNVDATVDIDSIKNNITLPTKKIEVEQSLDKAPDTYASFTDRPADYIRSLKNVELKENQLKEIKLKENQFKEIKLKENQQH